MNIRDEIIKNTKEKKLKALDLCGIMHIKGGKAKAAFFSTLKQLKNEKRIFCDEDGYLHTTPQKKKKKITINQGVIRIIKDGYGQIYADNKDREEKYTIYPKDLNGALDGDTVEFTTEHKEIRSGYYGAKVVKVLNRESGKAIFEYNGKALIPHSIASNIRVVCPKKELENLVAGNLVLVTLGKEVVAECPRGLLFEGNIEYIVGHKDDPDIEDRAIGAKYGFYYDYSKEAIKQLENINTIVTEEEKDGRVDFTDEKVFTIDGSHTKDRDDAISIKIDEEGNFILRVHISDVSHYIEENSPLDIEAKQRGTSLYMGDSVVPMLPHKISNGICSLNEGVDRLTKTVEIVIDLDGNVIEEKTKIYYSYINSKKAMTYEDVNKLLEEGKMPNGYESFAEELYLLYYLSELRNKKRREEGNIEFSSSDTVIRNEENDLKFEEVHQHAAEKMIENCMIIANEQVAKTYFELELPFISRNHEEPHLDSLVFKLRKLISEGLCGSDAAYLIKKAEKKSLTPYDLDNFLRKYKNTPVEEILSVDILTCMSKAFYSPEPLGHYGLGLEYYTHFTSPIRRITDLIIHRLIDKYEKQKLQKQELETIKTELSEQCLQASFMEREADKAEQESLELKMAEYGEKHIGDEYIGQIIAFKPYGLDIKLSNNLRGIVRTEDINIPDIKEKRKIKRGQRVYTVIKEVSIPVRAIYFEITGTEKTKAKQLIKEDL